MVYYSAAQKIEYYKKQLAFAKEENQRQLEQIDRLIKENDKLRFEINVLRNKSNETKDN